MTSLTYFITFVFDNSENFCKRFSTDISQRLSAKSSRYNTLNFYIFISFPSIFFTLDTKNIQKINTKYTKLFNQLHFREHQTREFSL